MKVLKPIAPKVKSMFAEDADVLSTFVEDSGIKNLSNEDYKKSLDRLGKILAVFGIEEPEIKKFTYFLTKIRDESLSEEEKAYLFKLIGNYFQESYKLIRYVGRFYVTESAVSTDTNLLLSPLVAAFLSKGFLAKISQANESDFDKVLDKISTQSDQIKSILINSSKEGATQINNALLDGLSGSSYVDMPTNPGLDGEDNKISDSEWFDEYYGDVKDAVQSDVEASQFKFNLEIDPNAVPADDSAEAPAEGEAVEEAPAEGEEAPAEGEEGAVDEAGGGIDLGGGGGEAPAEGEELPDIEGFGDEPAEGEAPAEEVAPEDDIEL
jgi:hypothetical protein